MTRRKWGLAAGVSLLTGCRDTPDGLIWKWTLVQYPGRLIRIFYRKEEGKTIFRYYENDRNALPGRNPWVPLKPEELPINIGLRGVAVASGTAAGIDIARAQGEREAAWTLRSRIYLLDVNSTERVLAYNGINLAQEGEVALGQQSPVGMALSPDRTQLYVLHREQVAFAGFPARPATVQVLRANPLALLRRIDLPSRIVPRLVDLPLVVSQDGRSLYLVNEGVASTPGATRTSTIVRLDIARGVIDGEVGGLPSDGIYGSLGVSRDGRNLYSLSTRGVAFVDLESFSLMTVVPVLASSMQVHPNGSRIYCAVSLPPRIQVIDTVSAQRVEPAIPLAASGNLSEIRITPDGEYLFAHHAASGAMHVVDLRRNVKVGEFPEAAAVGMIGI